MSSESRRSRHPRRTSLWLAVASGALFVIFTASVAAVAPPSLGHAVSTIRNSPTVCAAGQWPMQAAYDPVNHDLYVPIQAAHGPNVTVLGPTCHIVATIALSPNATPFAAAFDPQNDYVYVTDTGLSQVYVISGTTLIATIGGGWFSAPKGVTFDPGEGQMFVANWGVSNITGISGTSIAGTIPVGWDPEAIAYDPFLNTLLVTDYGSNNVTVISSATYPYSSSHSSVAVTGAWGIVYDPADELDYVGASGADNITIMDGSGAVLTTVHTAGFPEELCFDQANLRVYVSDRGGATTGVLALSGTAIVQKVHFPVGTYAIGVAYDGSNNKVYVSVDPPGSLEVL